MVILNVLQKGIIHKEKNVVIIKRVNELLEGRGQLGLVVDPKSEEGIVVESAFMVASDEHESRIAKIFFERHSCGSNCCNF